jgi:hypothetical protein
MSESPLPSMIPISAATVSISIIDTSTRISNLKTDILFQNPIPGHDIVDGLPSWSFLVEHQPTGTKLLFDLGLRVDWQSGVPAAGMLLNSDFKTLNCLLKQIKINFLLSTHNTSNFSTKLTWLIKQYGLILKTTAGLSMSKNLCQRYL